MTDDIDFEVPELAVPDEAAIRRAVLRGILRSGFAAASWLLAAAIMLVIALAGIGAVRVEGFANVVNQGIVAAHPEYDVDVGTFSNLGVSTIDVDLRPRGALDHPGVTPGRIRQPILGGIEVDLGPKSDTPVGDALTRTPPTKPATRAFLDGLPPQISVSAVVQLTRPLNTDAFFDLTSPGGPPAGKPECVFLTDPYSSDTTVSWPHGRLDDFVQWVRKLDSSDDEALERLGLPRASVLRGLADKPQVRAYIVERATVKQIRALLADERVRSVNVADVGFDPATQSGVPN